VVEIERDEANPRSNSHATLSFADWPAQSARNEWAQNQPQLQQGLSARYIASVATQWPSLRVRREGNDELGVIFQGVLLVSTDQ